MFSPTTVFYLFSVTKSEVYICTDKCACAMPMVKRKGAHPDNPRPRASQEPIGPMRAQLSGTEGRRPRLSGFIQGDGHVLRHDHQKGRCGRTWCCLWASVEPDPAPRLFFCCSRRTAISAGGGTGRVPPIQSLILAAMHLRTDHAMCPGAPGAGYIALCGLCRRRLLPWKGIAFARAVLPAGVAAASHVARGGVYIPALPVL